MLSKIYIRTELKEKLYPLIKDGRMSLVPDKRNTYIATSNPGITLFAGSGSTREEAIGSFIIANAAQLGITFYNSPSIP